jgi:chitin synthase
MLTINTIIQVAMIFSIVIHFFFRKAVPRKIAPDPETLETMAWVLPCYNETPLELTRSLESLARQVNLDDHKKVIIVIVDGKARGKGMDKSCGESLLEDILSCDERKKIKKAYIARDALDVPSLLPISTILIIR